VIRKIATAKNPFQKLERLLKMDLKGEVLRRQESGNVVIASREAMEEILTMIAHPTPKRSRVKKEAKAPQSESNSGSVATEAPGQADKSDGKNDESQNLPEGQEAK
jgi:hypothetical protein